ncbi:class I SAM-dependent methyltransferase [Magnetovirga frankeli]|uniref:methyltransferase domain-containing protein n=1 Tax=Magnetovirga frankeli TaxID=947516 RepID=UPI001AF139ED|nr:class I SAM-dependent methyltransferase [gamma proteobacterium SS-5]
MTDLIYFHHPQMEGTAELRRGLSQLRRSLHFDRCWAGTERQGPPSPKQILQQSAARQFLVILNPALIISDQMQQYLERSIPPGGCILPSDQRGFAPGVVLDYVNRSGLEDFVKRLQGQSETVPHDGRPAWIYLIERAAIEAMAEDQAGAQWSDLPDLLGGRSLICQHAYVHSYSDYYQGRREEMLAYLPKDVHHLLDVGGGQGGFAAAFMQQRQGKASLVEMNEDASGIARQKGIDVIHQPFASLQPGVDYDCISFLDVLEHMPDPDQVLGKAHGLLRPGGYLLLSVPNIGHWSVVLDLLHGRFEYLPVGILCETHIRFFTRIELTALLDETGFSIEIWHNQHSPFSDTFQAYFNACKTSGLQLDEENLQALVFHILCKKAIV